MAKKKLIHTDGFGNATNNKLPAYKPKPKPWVEGPSSRKARLERERHFWLSKMRDRKDIEEYVAFMKNEWRKQDEKN